MKKRGPSHNSTWTVITCPGCGRTVEVLATKAKRFCDEGWCQMRRRRAAAEKVDARV